MAASLPQCLSASGTTRPTSSAQARTPARLADSATADGRVSLAQFLSRTLAMLHRSSSNPLFLPISGASSLLLSVSPPHFACVLTPRGSIPAGEFYFISMDLGYRPLMPPNGLLPHASLLTPGPSDFRNPPRMSRPVSGFDLSARNSEPCAMEKIAPVTGKRRGGSRKACNECKQQKVS